MLAVVALIISLPPSAWCGSRQQMCFAASTDHHRQAGSGRWPLTLQHSLLLTDSAANAAACDIVFCGEYSDSGRGDTIRISLAAKSADSRPSKAFGKYVADVQIKSSDGTTTTVPALV